jgi:putative FmdB family regulatory protein
MLPTISGERGQRRAFVVADKIAGGSSMPIYEYRCEACGHEFEDLRGFNDPDPEACPECRKDAVRKLISGGNFHLKGSGWYVTDYTDKGAKPSKPTTESEKSSTPDGDSSSTDSGGGGDSDGEAA